MTGRYESPRVRNEIRSVLADIWDPLDVKNGRYSRSEYESYIYDVYRLLAKGATEPTSNRAFVPSCPTKDANGAPA